jgi:NDP-4-keto-2,6-dideoxyhexose 3-C-methyltransferase
MVRHLAGVADKVTSIVPIGPGDLVLDVGSNDGTLLRAFVAPMVTLVGMDPTAAKFRQYYPPEADVICERFSAERFRRDFGARKATVVTSIAMFYDLEAPMRFMEEIAEVLADDGIWVFEQSYLPTMVENTSYDTICHEHLEYYGLSQIQFMAERTGFNLLDVAFNDANGGSFLVTAGRGRRSSRNGDAIARILRKEAAQGYGSLGVYERFRDRMVMRRDELRHYLADARRRGERIFGYGASTKGNVILQYSDITTAEVPMIAELNPYKFGRFTPGTNIPIVSEDAAKARRPDAFLVLPWHFRDFIIAKEQEILGRGGTLVFPLPALDRVAAASHANAA